MAEKKGILYGVGVGPGDPELLTLKGARILRESDVIAVPERDNGGQTALSIVKEHVEGKTILNCATPMIRDQKKLDENYQRIADEICELLEQGKQVAFITLGDPTVYSTYIYIHKKVLARGYEAQLVAGVTSFCAVAAKLNISLCERSERLMIIPASAKDADECLDFPSNKIIMKAGRNLPELQKKLEQRGLLDRSAMVANCGLEGERVLPTLENQELDGSYFAVVVVKEGGLNGERQYED